MKSQKITNVGRTERKRRYDDGCAVAQVMDIIGERWALMVIRELMFAPRRFGDLKAALPGISANVLTQRLEGLEAAGVVERRKLPPPASVQVYALTPWGLESEPLFRVIGRWAARSPYLTPGFMSVASIILSMRTMFSPEKAAGVKAMIGFEFGHESFIARITKGVLLIEPGETSGADAIFICDQNILAQALYVGVPLDQLEAQGALEITGNRTLAEQYITLFPLPEPAPSGKSTRQDR
ncbi:MAG: winged helix-turn-helix transcriptional regulator [Sphingobium sp.]